MEHRQRGPDRPELVTDLTGPATDLTSVVVGKFDLDANDLGRSVKKRVQDLGVEM